MKDTVTGQIFLALFLVSLGGVLFYWFLITPTTTSQVQNSSQCPSEVQAASNPSSIALKAESSILKLREDQFRFATIQLVAVIGVCCLAFACVFCLFLMDRL